MEPTTLIQINPNEEGSSRFEIVEATVEEEEKDDSTVKQRKTEKEETTKVIHEYFELI